MGLRVGTAGGGDGEGGAGLMTRGRGRGGGCERGGGVESRGGRVEASGISRRGSRGAVVFVVEVVVAAETRSASALSNRTTSRSWSSLKLGSE
jgi:hypothetical protein